LKIVSKKILLLVFTSLIFLSCSDDPSSVGIDLIPDEDKIDFKQFDTHLTPLSQESSFHEAKLKLGISSKLLLGKTSFAESQMMLRYNVSLVDSLMNYLKNGQLVIRKVWIDLYPTYLLGDKSQNFNFTVHQIRNDWSPGGFDKDSLKFLQFDQSNVSIPSSFNFTDSLITVDIQPSVMQQWYKHKYDSLNTPKNFGLLFKPTSNTQKILGFNAIQIDVVSKLPVLSAVIERGSVFKDTITFTPFTDVHVVTGSLPIVTDKMYIQGGTSLRSTLFFNLSSLPKDIILSKANLELSIDTLNTFESTPKSDTLIVQVLASRTTKALNADSTLYVFLTRSGSKFTGEISWIVQKWLSLGDNYKNEGLLVSLFDELSTAARYTLFGSSYHDVNLRPRLKLIYIQKK
jgi:hypothetical protein